MVKKQKQSKTTQSQRLWIGVGVVAIIAVALVVGLGALSIQPTETGTATVFIFTRDGTQLNASETVAVYMCDYTNVTAAEFDAFVSDFGNYEELEINASVISGLTLQLEIKESQIYMVKIIGSVYFNEYFQIFPGDNRFVVSQKPDAAGMSSSLSLMNSTHMQGLSYITLYSVGDDIRANKNCSLPASIYDLETNTTKSLFLRLNKTTDYTAEVFNLTGCNTHVFGGDLFISLPGLNYYSEFEYLFEIAEMGTPELSLEYLFEIAEMGTPELSLVYATAGFETIENIVAVSMY